MIVVGADIDDGGIADDHGCEGLLDKNPECVAETQCNRIVLSPCACQGAQKHDCRNREFANARRHEASILLSCRKLGAVWPGGREVAYSRRATFRRAAIREPGSTARLPMAVMPC